MKPEKPHVHDLVPYEEESRLSHFEPKPNGGHTSTLSAIDTLKGWKCTTCPYKTVADLERKLA